LFAAEPDVDIIAGTTIEHFADGRRGDRIQKASDELIRILPVAPPLGQPSCFYREKLLETRHPPVDESYRYVMDVELWTYFSSIGARWKTILQPLSLAVQTKVNKTTIGGEDITRDMERIYLTYVHERIPLTWWHRRLRYPLERVRHNHRGPVFSAVYYPYQCAIIALLSPFYGFRRVRWMNWSDIG
jgi:hypothetical protein